MTVYQIDLIIDHLHNVPKFDPQRNLKLGYDYLILTTLPVNSTPGKSICGAPVLDHSKKSHLPYQCRNMYLHRTSAVDNLNDLPHHDDMVGCHCAPNLNRLIGIQL